MSKAVLFSWSGGKDCAMAFYQIQQDPAYEIAGVLTTITEEYDRISMHGVRRILLEQQLDSLQIPAEKIEKVVLPVNASNEEYEKILAEVLLKYKAKGVDSVVFGDIFLNDVRRYREANLKELGLVGLFPLWLKETKVLAEEFFQLGFKATTVCVDGQILDKRFIGRDFNPDFLKELPPGVDPCGEYGEFHTFVYDGPNFQYPIPFSRGEIIFREQRFYYCDLVQKSAKIPPEL